MALTRAELIAAGIVVPGSTSAQSFIPTGNTVPSNGLYLSTTNTVAIATNSVGRLFIDANGNINQGTVAAFFAKDHTNTPKTVQFQSARTGETVFNLASFETGFDGGGGLLSFTKSRSVNPANYFYLGNNQTIGRIVFSGDDGFGFTPGAAIVSTTDQASGITAPNMVAGTSYKIYSVGTSNFTLVGAASNTVGTVFTATGSTTGSGEVVPANGTTAANLRFMTTPFGSSSPQERLRITSSGSIGVGTTSPSALFHLNSGGNTELLVSSTFSGSPETAIRINTVGDASRANIYFSKSGTNRGSIQYYHNAAGASERLDLNVSGSAGLSLNGAGLLGVGTQNPVGGATKMTVNGDISLAGGTRSFLSNLYYDNAWKYVANGSAFGIIENGGKTLFTIAGNNTGGAGAAATVSYPLTITSTNRIGINSTDPPQMLTMSGGNAYLLSNTTYSPQVIVENNTNDATAGYFILSKSRAGTRNLVGDNLGTLLWRATNFDNAMSNTNTSLICDVTDTPVASGLVRTGLSLNSDRYIRFNTINGEAARITDSNLLFIGHSSSQVVAQTSAKLEISGGDIGSVNIIRRSNNSFGANMYFAKSRNTTHNQYTILQHNDELGSIFFCGDDGTDFNHAGAIIRAYVDTNNSPIAQDKMPGGLIFMTNPGVNANDAATPRMYITPHGHIGINNYPGQATLFRITGYGDGFGGYHNTFTVEPTLYGTAASAEARCILTYPLTQANTTVGELQHILCAQNTFDATSTVTTQIGLKILANLTGATNNWAIYSDIPTNTKGAGGTNTNFNVYVAGSAPSYFNSPVRIGNSSGRSNFYNTTGVPAIFQVEGAGSFPGRAVSQTFGATGTEGPIYIFAKHKSASIGGQTLVAAGDQLGVISFQGSDGTEFYEAANILSLVEGTPAANVVPARLAFSTTDSTGALVERARITSQGYFKASNNATYVLSTGNYHEFNQSNNNIGVYTTIRASGYTSTANLINYTSTATTSYSYIQCYSGNFSDIEFTVRGDGAVFGDGSYTVGADYAEYFEWADGNPDNEDRRGYPVVLEGGKIRKAKAGEEPIGVISSRPSVVGDAAPSMWAQKYLKDDFGAYLYEDKEVENEDGEIIIEKYKILNPDYDPEQQYVSREDRPEWDAVGLVGKLRIRKGLPVGAKWIKLRDISDAVEEWLVR